MKRFLSLLLALLMLFSLLGTGAFADSVDTTDLAAAQLRRAMVNRCETYDFSISVSLKDIGGDPSDNAVSYGHSLLDVIFDRAYVHTGLGCEGDYLYYSVMGYNYNFNCSWDMDSCKYSYSLDIQYYDKSADEESLGTKLQQVESSLGLASMTDYDKVRTVYDYICDTVTYAYDDTSYSFTAYNALVNGRSVCQGYATLLYRMLLDCGIDNRIISGSGNGGSHVWNLIRLGGKYYLADVTWDDGFYSYYYFLKGISSFDEHYADSRGKAIYELYGVSSEDYSSNSDACANGHNFIDGKCTRCGADDPNYQPHTHSYAEYVTAPTCTRGGYTEFICDCGSSYVDRFTDSLGHDFGKWTVTKEATESDTGIETRCCSRCTVSETRIIPVLYHTHIYTVDIIYPSCTGQGYTTHTCDCGDTYTDSFIAALGHCFVNGVCARCGELEQDYVNPFLDVPENSYYKDAVLWAYNHEPQVTGGIDATTFNPSGTCTRAQIVTFLWRANGCPEPTNTVCTFTDVAPTSYYYKAVLWAVENGITGGYNSTTFGSNDKVTRAQAVTFMWRSAGQPAPITKGCSFADVPFGSYYYSAVLWAGENHITGGYDAYSFGSADGCTRAQIVTFLYRLLG